VTDSTADLMGNALEPLIHTTLRGLEREHGVDDLAAITGWPGLVAQRLSETPGTATLLFGSLADLIADVSQVHTRLAEFAFEAAAVGNLGVTLLRAPGQEARLGMWVSRAITEAQLADQIRAVLAAAGTSDDEYIEFCRPGRRLVPGRCASVTGRFSATVLLCPGCNSSSTLSRRLPGRRRSWRSWHSCAARSWTS